MEDSSLKKKDLLRHVSSAHWNGHKGLSLLPIQITINIFSLGVVVKFLLAIFKYFLYLILELEGITIYTAPLNAYTAYLQV